MVHGNMCIGIVDSELMVRVGAQQYESALALPNVRKMDFTGRPMKGFVFVSEGGFQEDVQIQQWVNRALQFVQTLPSK